jgi:hypothetical protein
MICLSRNQQPTAGRLHSVLEWLEPRSLLTGLPPSIAAVQPYDNQQLQQPPTEVDIYFNGVQADALMTGFDVQIEALNRDGTRTPLWTGAGPPETTDASGTELIVPIQTFDANTFTYDNDVLPPGTYEIDLIGGTGISVAASHEFGPGPELWDPSQDHAIGTFTVLGAGASFGGATDLNTIGTSVQSVLGVLDPNNYQSAVDIYRFTLAPGHFWQLGLSVSAQDIGSDLLPALTLFDADGNVLATRNAGTGLPGDVNDPYLFTGLEPGTYYVGVSGANNLPYVNGGYDPVYGIPGTDGLSQSGGPFAFELGLVAMPHDQTTRLVDFTLNRADRLDSSPTSLTLTFSAPIDLGNLFTPDTAETALEVVDSSGQVWPTTALEYESDNASLTLVFDQPLPAGHYSLVIPSQGGLTDLVGQPVVATGEPAGVMATWDVAPPSGPGVPNNLGVLWPGTSQATPSAGAGAFAVTTNLAPGQSVTYRWVVIVPGYYTLNTQGGTGQVAILNFGDGQTTVLDPGSTVQLNNYPTYLNSGVYGLRFINVGSQPAQVDWLLKISSLDWEKILDNGVSQVSALSLGFLSSTPSNQGTNSFASIQGISGASATSVFPGSMGPIPNSLLVTLNTSLIGQPTLQSQNVSPVGPAVEMGSMALAGNTTGLPLGIRYGSVLADEDQSTETELADAESAPNDQTIRLAGAGTLPGLDPESGSARADAQALAQAEWLVRLGARLQSWLVPSPGLADVKNPVGSPLDTRAMVRNDPPSGPRAEAVLEHNKRFGSKAQADLGVVSVLTVGVVAYRMRRPLQKWWRQGDRAAVSGQGPASQFCRGPHPSSARAHATTHLRKPRRPSVQT